MSIQSDNKPDHEIVTIRDVNASIHFVFKAWTDPVHLVNWWGPKGFTNTFQEFDLRPNGRWSLTMHGPDGTDYPNESVFVEIKEPTLFSFDHLSGHFFRVITNFEALTDNTTRIIFRMIFNTAEERDSLMPIIPEKNEESFDRLEAELAKMKM